MESMRAHARVGVSISASSEVIFHLVSFTGIGMALQITGTKQSEGVSYFVEFCLGT